MKKKIPAVVKSAREAALWALVRFEQDGAYLNLALPPLLKNLNGDDRSLAIQLAAGTVQRLNTLDWALALFYRKDLETLTPMVRNLLRLSAYQILYLDRIPDYAVVDEAVNLARRFGHRGVAGLVNALLRQIAKQAKSLSWPDPEHDPMGYLSLKHSYPLWLIARVVERFGLTKAEEWCLANNQKPLISIRPNPLHIKPGELIDKLQNEGVEAFVSPLIPGMLRIKQGNTPALTESFREGFFTIQGESSALVALLLNPQPGETIIDLCSAPGGKTTHLAELTGDQGLIYAVEVNPVRLQLVERAYKRLGLQSIKPVLADGRAIDLQGLPEPDAILIDAPCSGLGVIRRLPEIKWRRNEKDLPALQKLQLELLSAAARLLKPGGRLLYSVCSNQPEETTRVVELFNSDHPGFVSEQLGSLLPLALKSGQDHLGPVSLWPHLHELDGFFIARWRKAEKAGTR